MGFCFKQIAAGYGEHRILSDISAEAKEGEILVLLGANGTGKSTLLKTAAGLLPPMAGDVLLSGRSLSEYSADARAKKMSVLLAERGNVGQMSCREIVEMGRYPYTGRFGILGKEDRRIVSEAMAFTHTEQIADTDFEKISDGQRQRVRLARSIAQEPEVLLLDEPTVFLDIRYQAEFLQLLKQLCTDRKMTAILSMHEVGMALAVANRLLCLKDGGVYAYGTPDELRSAGVLPELYDISIAHATEDYEPGLAAYLKQSFGEE